MKPITSGQKEQCANVVKDAARKATEEAVVELEQNGALDGESIQRIQGNPQLSVRVKEFVKNLLAELAENIRGCLKLISGGETLTLDPTDGTEIIANEGDLFNYYLDGDFKKWKTNVKGKPTEKQNIVIHEQIKDGRFRQIYSGLGDNLDTMCLSQGQIIQFFKQKKYKNYLIHEKPGDSGYGWFRFLFKVGDEFFVADVNVNSGGRLSAFVYRFSLDFVWRAARRVRFVVPQLALAS